MEASELRYKDILDAARVFNRLQADAERLHRDTGQFQDQGK